MGADWIAVSSLFYDGPIECKVEMHDFSERRGGKTAFYNIYSLEKIKNIFQSYGYGSFFTKKFVIGVDLERPGDRGIGTYTRKLEDGERLQFSGPLFLPWYFVAASKI